MSGDRNNYSPRSAALAASHSASISVNVDCSGDMAREIDDGEQEIADLFGQAGAVRLAEGERALDLVGFLADFREHGARIVPVEADASGFLLQLERAGERRQAGRNARE